MSHATIYSFVGAQGSGKSTIGKAVSEALGAQHIEASSVVRSIYGDLPRDEMPKTNERTATEPSWLGDAIWSQITWNPEPTPTAAVLSGVRELEVHDTLAGRDDVTLHVIRLWAPPQERYARLKALGKCDSYTQFVRHGFNEMKLGLEQLMTDPRGPLYATSEFMPVEQVVEHILRDIGLREMKGMLV